MYFANSNAYKMTNSDWLPRGMIEVISDKVSSFVQKDKIKIDLEKLIVYPVVNSTKKILFFVLCRIP